MFKPSVVFWVLCFLLSSCFCHGVELRDFPKAYLQSEVKVLDWVVSGLCGTGVSQCHISWLSS